MDQRTVAMNDFSRPDQPDKMDDPFADSLASLLRERGLSAIPVHLETGEGRPRAIHLVIQADAMAGFYEAALQLGGARCRPAGAQATLPDRREDWLFVDPDAPRLVHVIVTEDSDRPVVPRGRFALPSGGAIIALIGADGAGKSVQAAAIAEILGSSFPCLATYSGSGEGGWAIRRSVKRHYHRASRKKGGSGAARADKRLTHPTRHAAIALATAIERYFSVAKAQRAKKSGMLVISDRWPQKVAHGLFDGPSIPNPDAPMLARWLQKVEHRLHGRIADRHPDLSIHLDIDFATSNQRKPGDRTPADFAQRCDIMASMRQAGGPSEIVDARASADAVTSAILNRIWAVVRASGEPPL